MPVKLIALLALSGTLSAASAPMTSEMLANSRAHRSLALERDGGGFRSPELRGMSASTGVGANSGCPRPFCSIIPRVLPTRAETEPTALSSGVAPVGAENITAGGAHIENLGSGVFKIRNPSSGTGSIDTATIDLKRVRHAYDPAIDADVPLETDVTLNEETPPLIDASGRPYALITLYQIDPPLADLPSREPGIDRGMDFRDPANLVKGAYSNYVSPVITNDNEEHRVQSHPIGHFYVQVEIPGVPTVLTGITTTKRADAELEEYTLGRQLGIGGVLLTPEPGRLNSAKEALDELTLRQRELRVVDGLHYRTVGGRNVGPEYIVKDGNVVFARFKIPPKNAKDALAFFVEFIARGQHNIFGSLINRPNRGTGAGCTPFAMSWLQSAGVLPFISEPRVTDKFDDVPPESLGIKDFWQYLHRTLNIPWDHIGCDDRLGVTHTIAADYTIYDLLFFHESKAFIAQASEGLAQKVKEDYGLVAATLFQFGALTPLRDLVINSKRKDPEDLGDYTWTEHGEGFAAAFWDNKRFSAWVKALWAHGPSTPEITLVREGRFYGIEVDAMTAPRQEEPFFSDADRISEMRQRLERPTSCRQLFNRGIQ